MFYRTAFKWLSITVIVLIAFLIVLLLLGYLLKENEEVKTKLKAKLEEEAYQQQQKEQRKSNPFSHLPAKLNALEKSQQKIIADNKSCTTEKQCILIHTHSPKIGCIVAVNITGAAILLAASAKNENQQLSSKGCQQEYENQPELSAQCLNNLCSF